MLKLSFSKPSRRPKVHLLILGALLMVSQVIAPKATFAQAGNCKAGGQIDKFQPTNPPVPFTDQTFYTGTGELRTISDFSGKGVILNFWATWCAPCIKEMPALNRLQEQVKADGILVLPLSEDRKGAAVIDPFYAQNNLTALPVLIDKRRLVMRKTGVSALPTTIFIDRQGMEVGRILGEAAWDSAKMTAFIRNCFGKAPPSVTQSATKAE